MMGMCTLLRTYLTSSNMCAGMGCSISSTPWSSGACATVVALRGVGEVSELLEETINRVRQGPFDLRAANAIGVLAGILLKALDQRLEKRLAHLETVLSEL